MRGLRTPLFLFTKKFTILQFSCKITYKKSKFLHILHFKPYPTIFLLHFLLSKKCTFPTLNIALLDTFIALN
nr:MAG TPA: hypothetical protein [Caudoviricetes sp.]